MDPRPSPEPSWPDPPEGIAIRFVEANGIRFELAECLPAGGDTGRLALCLHGFPEIAYSWRHQMPLLAARGWRVWAPNMRGYGATSKPPHWRDYAMDHLLADVAALVDLAGPRELMLVAHDWGAIIAWMFAIRKVRPLAKLVIMNVPHPKPALREARHWHQLRKSWYIGFFQLPRLPEKMLLRHDARGIRQAFVGMAVEKSRFPRDVLDVYARAAQRPGAMKAMIDYYRALVRTGTLRDIGDARVEVPTLMVWGEEDSALDIRTTDGTGDWVPDLELHRLPQVSHWVQQEAPEQVNAILGDWLERRGG